jgi:type II secretory pathway pseudopilin PulG
MAALLVSLAVMSVLMSVAMPVWRHEAQREKEAELVFRGQQYVRAIRLFQMKTGTFPTSVDLLVQGHYLRKKFKDPITDQEFEYVGAAGAPGQTGQPGVGQPGRGATPSGAGAPGRGGQTPAGGFGTGGTTTGGAVSGGTIPGGMMGVRSKSKDQSIKLYLGRNHYNEWMFTYVGQQQMPGGPGRGQPGGPGGTRGGPGGRGPTGPGGAGPRGLAPPPGFPGGPGRGGRGPT